MKTFFLSLIFLFSLSIFAGDVPLFGVSSDGIYFVHQSLVEKIEGSSPKVLFGPNWSEQPMRLEGEYYVYRSGRPIYVKKVSYCFAVGGSHYLPHVLADFDIPGASFSELESRGEVRDNLSGGYNFYTKPVRFPG
jgi:hypothetical protein